MVYAHWMMRVTGSSEPEPMFCYAVQERGHPYQGRRPESIASASSGPTGGEKAKPCA
jgi:hypothetical protein